MKTIIFFLALMFSIILFVTIVIDSINYCIKRKTQSSLWFVYMIIVSALWTYFYYL